MAFQKTGKTTTIKILDKPVKPVAESPKINKDKKENPQNVKR